MIYESWPWRQDLLKDADILDRWAVKAVTERRSALIEKKVFVGAYSMRRLLQSEKLSTITKNKSIACRRFRSINPMDWHGRWGVWDYYDLTNGTDTNLSFPRVLDLIIHSYIFMEFYETEDTTTPSIAFNSDMKRNDYLWSLPLSDFTSLMRFIAMDNPPNYQRRRIEGTGEWEVWQGFGDPPW